MHIKSLFISRNAAEVSTLTQFTAERGISLFTHSFLKFEMVPFQQGGQREDVIFFGSPKAAKFFLEQVQLPESISIAAVGASTAKTLQDSGFSCDFIGSGSDTHKIASEFKSWLGNRSVLFPQSDRSLQTVSKVINPSQKRDVIVYRTFVEAVPVETCDMYVLTSPSNAEGFILANTVPESSIIVAWGTSTAEYLANMGVSSICLDQPSLESLISYIKTR